MIVKAQNIISAEDLASGVILTRGKVNLFLQTYVADKKIKSFLLKSLKANDVLIPFNCNYKNKQYTYTLEYIAEKESQLFPYEMDTNAQHNFANQLYMELTEQYASLSITNNLLVGEDNHDTIISLIAFMVDVDNELFKRRIQNREENAQAAERDLTAQINSLGKIASFKKNVSEEDEKSAANISNDYYVALQFLAKTYDFDLNKGVTAFTNTDNPQQIMQDFQRLTSIRMRKITLEPGFYKEKSSPILGFIKDGEFLRPVAIYLRAEGSYYLSNNNEKQPINANNAEDFALFAFCFYESFRQNITTKVGLLEFVFRRAYSIIFLLIILAGIGAVFSFIMPTATQHIVNTLIPSGNMDELGQLMLLLLVLTICQICVSIVPEIIMLFFSTIQFERFQAALYDRLLKLRMESVSNWERGDLANRIMSANSIQATIFDVFSQQFTGAIFALASVFMMFVYSPMMAIVGIGFVFIYALVFFMLSVLNYNPLKKAAETGGKISSLLTQFIDGVAKIRAANAKNRITSRFMRDFGEESKLNYIISRNGTIQSIASLVFPTLVSISFYAIAGGVFSKGTLSIGAFMAFMVAFQSFQAGVMGVSGGIWSMLAIKPDYDRIYPLLCAPTESDDNKPELNSLFDGSISLAHINFKYDNSENLVLNDVSIEAKNGEFVAIVGPSGAGKSSLVRILLGFNEPANGAVYYGNSDLNRLNLKSVRNKLGVILQNDHVFAGSILDNIIMGTSYTADEAKEALAQASFLEEVEAMPMGIFTLISPETISGGQQQRILIARALVGKPKAIIMDESTSALDNLSQENVANNLSKLNVTRIVIAHRLSTIIGADRIYVLNHGCVEEVGNYEQLMSKNGLFRELANRQQC